jgi:hypothetical protein
MKPADDSRRRATAQLARRLLQISSMEGERAMNVATVARRVLAEFREMPGMALTPRQASKLFGLEQEVCRLVLDMLVDAAYLRETIAGQITLGERLAA